MRRLFNILLLLLVAGAILVILGQAGLLRWPSAMGPSVVDEEPEPTLRPELRISVADRPEIYLTQALKRLMESERQTAGRVEFIPYDPQTAWLSLNAGEIDLVVVSLSEAIRGQALFQGGRLLFFSGLSEGYDRVSFKGDASSGESPETIGIRADSGHGLFALLKYPEAQLIAGRSQQELEDWLLQDLVQAAMLESAKLSQEASGLPTLSATSVEDPLPTVVVLSERFLEERETQSERWETLIQALNSWTQLVGYIDSQPELLRSTLRRESQQDGVDVEVLLKDYRFLTPGEGRAMLMEVSEQGVLKRILDLLVVAWVDNLVSPDWNRLLEIPQELETELPSPQSSPVPSEAPLEEELTETEPVSEGEDVSQDEPAVQETTGLDLGTYTLALSSTLPDPWPEPLRTFTVQKAGQLPAVLSGDRIGIGTNEAFIIYQASGRVSATWNEGTPLTVTSDSEHFYLGLPDAVVALDRDGNERWRFPAPGLSPKGDFLLANGFLLICSGNGKSGYLTTLNSADGSLRWQQPLAAEPQSGPVLLVEPEPTVAVLDNQGNLASWGLTSGALMWQTKVSKTTQIPLSAQASDLALVHPEGRLSVHSALQGGKQIWSTDLKTPVVAPATLTPEKVMVPAKDTYLYLMNRQDQAKTKDTVRLAVPLSQPAIVIEKNVFLSDESGQMHCLNLETGALKWSKEYSKTALFAPNFNEEYWVLTDRQGRVTVFGF